MKKIVAISFLAIMFPLFAQAGILDWLKSKSIWSSITGNNQQVGATVCFPFQGCTGKDMSATTGYGYWDNGVYSATGTPTGAGGTSTVYINGLNSSSYTFGAGGTNLSVATSGTSTITYTWTDPGYLTSISGQDLSTADNSTSVFITATTTSLTNYYTSSTVDGFGFLTDISGQDLSTADNTTSSFATTGQLSAYLLISATDTLVHWADASTSNWDLAYGWGNHATQNYATTGQLALYVPYTGATGNVDLGSFSLTATSVISDTLTSQTDSDVDIELGIAENTIHIHPGFSSGDNYFILYSASDDSGSPQLYPSMNGSGQIGTATNFWGTVRTNALTLGSGNGFLKAVSGVVSATSILVSDISDIATNYVSSTTGATHLLTSASSSFLWVVNDLSDVASATIAKTNLGLGTGDSPTFTGLTLSGVTSTVLAVDSNGQVVATTSGGTPSGSDTYVQYNNNGSFGSESAFIYNATTNTMTVAGGVSSQYVNIGNSGASSFSADLNGSTLAKLKFYSSNGGNIPAGYSAADLFIDLSWAEAGSGNHPLIAGIAIDTPYISDGAGTVSSTAALYIEGVSTTTASNGNYAIWVDDGPVQFDGNLTVGGSTTFSSLTNGFLKVDASGAVSTGTITLGINTDGAYAATVNGATGTVSLTGGDHITASGTAFYLDSEISTGSYSWTFAHATTSFNNVVHKIFVEDAITVTEIGGISDGSMVMSCGFGSPTSYTTSTQLANITLDTDGASTTSFGDATIPARQNITCKITSISSGTSSHPYIIYTIDD